MGALKALDPDGLNGLFYNNQWETMKQQVCIATRSFFEEGIFPTKVNVVALVPKVPLP